MSFIDNEARITGQIGLGKELSKEHSVRHVFEHRLVTCAILEANRVSYFVPDLCTHFVSHSGRNRHRRHTSRLSATNFHTTFGISRLVKILRQLGRLARSSLGDHNKDLVLSDSLDKLIPVGVYGEGFPSFFD